MISPVTVLNFLAVLAVVSFDVQVLGVRRKIADRYDFSRLPKKGGYGRIKTKYRYRPGYDVAAKPYSGGYYTDMVWDKDSKVSYDLGDNGGYGNKGYDKSYHLPLKISSGYGYGKGGYVNIKSTKGYKPTYDNSYGLPLKASTGYVGDVKNIGWGKSFMSNYGKDLSGVLKGLGWGHGYNTVKGYVEHKSYSKSFKNTLVSKNMKAVDIGYPDLVSTSYDRGYAKKVAGKSVKGVIGRTRTGTGGIFINNIRNNDSK